MKRNGKIELLRFLFAISVLCFHVQKYLSKEIKPKGDVYFAFFPHGAMGVEFFFVLTGFLMAASVFFAKESDRKLSTGKSTILFMGKKFMAIFPMHLIAFVFVFLATVICKHYSLEKSLYSFFHSIPGLFFVQMAGFGFNYVNNIEWYLSVMLICMCIIYPMLRKWYDTFSRVIAPLSALLILGYIMHTYGYLVGVSTWVGITYKSMLRGFSEICLGIFCFEVCRFIQSRNITPKKRLMISAIELASWVGAFGIIMFTFAYKYNIYALAFIAIGITCTFTGISYGSEVFNKKPVYYLGKLSLPIYLIQLMPIKLIPVIFEDLPLKAQMAITIIATIVLAIGLLHLTELITKTKKAKTLIKA